MRNIVEKKDIKFKPRFKAEFSMGQYDYVRYNRILEEADILAIKIGQMNIKTIIPFFSVLKVFWRNIKPNVFETTKDNINGEFKKINNMIDWRTKGLPNPPFKIINKLEELHADLLEIKQIMGLGIQVKKELTKKQKWERALKIGD